MDYNISSRFTEYALSLVAERFKNVLGKNFSMRRTIDRKQQIILEIDVLSRISCERLWMERKQIADMVCRLGIAQKVVLKMRGCLFGSFSPQNLTSTSMIVPVSQKQKTHYTYGKLLKRICESEYPAFVTEIPQDWHWGQPLPCILTSAQVTQFSGRIAPKWHGDDVTLLYDRQDFERQYETLMAAFHLRTNKDEPYVLVQNVEYKSYTVDKSRESLVRNALCEYNSDFEVIWLEDIRLLVRVCYCKDRRLVF